ncbi:hypothetical protein AGMMS49928_17930 [Spirochaetia bacterium]|nr:hypothetical protein AGMMS49928_17930 [Spirochaetia bacterium]
MKKRIVVAVLLVVFASALGFASEELEIFTYLYNAAESPADQLGILQSVMEMKIPGAGSFYQSALSKLVRQYPAIKQRNRSAEVEDADSLALILAESLGSEKQVSSAADIWRIANPTEGGSENPLVKAEAFMALGKMRSPEHLPKVIKVLEDLNARPVRGDPVGAERTAYGAILSLEKYGDPSGYLPVFFASVGWYSDRIKGQAAQSCSFILKDPSDQMMNIIRGQGYTPAQKLGALRNVEKSSDIANPKKSEIAVAGITWGWTTNPRNNNERATVATLRKESMQMIAKYGTSDSSVYPQLQKSYASQGLDRSERLLSIGTLKTLKTDQAAQLLNQFLADLNSQQKAGSAVNKQENEVMAREIIPALGTIANSSSRPFLVNVASSNWGSTVDTLARDALSKIR